MALKENEKKYEKNIQSKNQIQEKLAKWFEKPLGIAGLAIGAAILTSLLLATILVSA